MFVLWQGGVLAVLFADADLCVHSEPLANVTISFLPRASVFSAHTFLDASFGAIIFPACFWIKGIFFCKNLQL